MLKAIVCSAVAIAALSLGGVAHATPVSSNLLVDGNLSNGLTGWTSSGSTSLQTPAVGATYLLFPTSPGGWISQTFADVAGQHYTLSYNVTIVGGGVAGYAFDQNWVVNHYTTGTYALTYQFIGTGADTLSFNGAADTTAASVQESSFSFTANASPATQVPEPASLALLGGSALGLCLLLASRRRPTGTAALGA